ncbi:unnamed protein product [Notodromas monacha]|uniref:GOLD domain-containing protein n=1 Tax=Notodromas monacha TaxID=399045 RepID=A0A7R9BHB0_9CRUS|nr:unnamed protein product [Notodromas monacha]CAG0914431.1 unnamed protein product [Notodromas monacha]
MAVALFHFISCLVLPVFVESMMFHLAAGPGNSKCLSDQVHKNVLVAGRYNVSEVSGHAVDLSVTDSGSQTLVSRVSTTGGKFVFINDDVDLFQICFVSRIVDQKLVPRKVTFHQVFLDVRHGVEAKSYEGLKNTAKLQEMEVELRRLEDLSASIMHDFNVMKEREATMRDTNESTNSRVLLFSAFGILWLAAVAAPASVTGVRSNVSNFQVSRSASSVIQKHGEVPCSICEDDGGQVVKGDAVKLDGLPPSSPKTEWCGPADPVSNIRHMLLPTPSTEGETHLQRKLRITKEAVNVWHQSFWKEHNTAFFKGKQEWMKVHEVEGTRDPVRVSEFYKKFLDQNWERHVNYNFEWYKKNLHLILLSLLVQVEGVVGKLRVR